MLQDVEKFGKQKAAEADVAGFKEELGPFVVAAETTETTRMPRRRATRSSSPTRRSSI